MSKELKITNISLASSEVLDNLLVIFYESSSVNFFENDEARKKFQYKYFDYYLENFKDNFFYISSNNSVLGYICGLSETVLSEELLELFPYYKSLDKDFLKKYPSHLHINLSSDSRGMGVGSKLMSYYLMALKQQESPGVHIFTSPNAQNLSFYRQNDFCDELSVEFNNHSILAMGCKISSN